MFNVTRGRAGSLLVVAICFLLLGIGCESEQPNGETEAGLDTEPGAESPNHAVRKLLLGMSEGRGDVVASAIEQETEGGEAFAEFMRGMADLNGEVRNLQQEVQDKFGEEGLAVFEETLDFEAEMQPEQVEQMEIELDGEQAVARLPDDAGPMDEPIRMVRRDDRWYVQPPAEMAEMSGQISQMVMDAMQRQIDAVRTAIDEARTVEELEENLETAGSAGFPLESPADVPEELGPLDDEE